MNNKLKLLTGLFGVSIFVIFGIFAYSSHQEKVIGADLPPVHLQVKAPKADIFHSSTKDGVTKYDWDTKVPVLNEIDQEVLRKAQAGGFNITGEIIEKRTSNSKVFSTDAVNEFGNPVFVGNFISGERQYHKNSNGDWTLLGNNTTTEEVFLAYMKPTLLERFAGLFKQKVIAANFPIDANGADGFVSRASVNENLATIHDGVGTSANDSGSQDFAADLNAHASSDPNYQVLSKGIFNFDTSVIGSGQQVDTGSLTIYSRGSVLDGLGGNGAVGVTTATTASDTALAAGDYQTTVSGTRLADTDIDLGSWASDSVANIWTLNATGLLNVEMEGVSKFATRIGNDIDDSVTGITWASSEEMLPRSYMSEEGGTAKDPKLTLTWSAVSVAGGEVMMMGMTF